MANTGTGDVADVDGRRAERLQMPGRSEHLLKGAWPTGILIEQISFGLTAASHQNPVERLIRSRSRQLVPVLAFTIDFDPHHRLQLGERVSIGMQPETQAGREYVAGTPTTDPPSGGELGHDDENQQEEQTRHATNQPVLRTTINAELAEPAEKAGLVRRVLRSLR